MRKLKNYTTQSLDFNGHKIEVVITENKQVYWSASQVATAVGYSQYTNMLRSLGEKDYSYFKVVFLGKDVNIPLLTQQGLRTIEGRSMHATAKVFGEWAAQQKINLDRDIHLDTQRVTSTAETTPPVTLVAALRQLVTAARRAVAEKLGGN